MTDELSDHDPLNDVAALLREPLQVMPGLGARAEARRGRRRTRVVVFTCLAVAALVARGITLDRSGSGTPVVFSISVPAGRSVSVVGDFTEWRSVALQPGAAGMWQATVRLKPGRYRYAFLVDHAQWRADNREPSAPDDFGRPTSTVTVVHQ